MCAIYSSRFYHTRIHCMESGRLILDWLYGLAVRNQLNCNLPLLIKAEHDIAVSHSYHLELAVLFGASKTHMKIHMTTIHLSPVIKRNVLIEYFRLFYSKKKKVHPVPGSNPSKKKNCVLPFGCKQNCTEIMHIYTRMGNNRKIDKRVEFENNKKNVRLAECLMASDVAVPPSYRAWIQHIKCIYVVESPMIQDSTPVQ